MKRFLHLITFLATTSTSFSQTWTQYFDGADTSGYFVDVVIAPDSTNCWQVGRPSKNIFDTASTIPNAILTDSINSYPINNFSSFGFSLLPDMFPWGIIAIQWKQKLDMEFGKDGGLIEYSIDRVNWIDAFNNPYVYNFYGFDPSNVTTIAGGNGAFSGTDSTWKDVWLCYDNSWASTFDTIHFRFTLKSDTTDTQQEGWMIDNLMVHLTMIHTVDEIQQEYLKVFPTLTEGIVNIKAKKSTDYHIIEKMELRDVNGRLVQTFGISPTKFTIDIGHHPNGIYFLTVQTNMRTETVKLVLQH